MGVAQQDRVDRADRVTFKTHALVSLAGFHSAALTYFPPLLTHLACRILAPEATSRGVRSAA